MKTYNIIEVLNSPIGTEFKEIITGTKFIVNKLNDNSIVLYNTVDRFNQELTKSTANLEFIKVKNEDRLKSMIGKIVIHFKGKNYLVLGVAKNTETNEDMVIYKALYDDFKIYARPKEMFLSKVDKCKYPNCKQEYRFELI